MNENIVVVLSACITAAVTIIFTYFLNKRNFKSEIDREKN